MSWNRRARCALGFAIVAFMPYAAAQEGRGDVVYVPTPQVVVEEMLRMAKIGPKDFLIDLGSGDGRIVITAVKKFGAQGFGVDLDAYLLKLARDGASKEGITDRAGFVEQNLFETDLSKATVISSYLLPEMNLKLRPKILALKPGTRVVAHDYHMGDWYPDEQKDIPVPEKKVGTPGVSYVYLWVVPSPVAGKWQGSMNAGGKDVPLELAIEQLFQILDGTLRVGSTPTQFRGRVSNGDQITFTTQPKDSPGNERHEFRGRIEGDTIEGTVRIGEGPKSRESKFTVRVTARGEMRRAADELASR
jgi:hypothetical protein